MENAEKEEMMSGISNNSFTNNRGGYRDRCFDIAKGIGIILVVCGHARAPFNHFLSLFHMALFFMISGYLYNGNCATDFQSVNEYTFKKIKSLWIPYFVSNLFFILMNNVFISIGIYSTNPTFLDIVTGSRNELAKIYGLKDYAIEIFKAFFMLDNAQLGGALWFLRSLLMITVGHNILMWLTENKKYKNVVRVIVLVVCTALAVAMNDINSIIPDWESRGWLKVAIKAGRQLFAPYLVYVLGMGFRKLRANNVIQANKALVGIASFLMLVILGRFGRVDLSMGIITNLVYFIVVSCFGYSMVISVGYLIEQIRFLSRPLEYLGKHTMCIIALHLLSFKLISYLYLMMTDSEPILLASFPVLDAAAKYLWVAYSIVGVGVPIACYQIYGTVSQKIKNRIKRESVSS